ncbi:unnamed protein product, partial [Rotaria magnacalcarata]
KQIKRSICLTIIENGFGHNDAVYQILIDTVLKDNFEKFLDDCTKKIELTAHARKVYNYRGDEIKSLRMFLDTDECKVPTTNDDYIYGPVWISKGERFRPTGAYIYLETRYQELNIQYKKIKIQYKEVILVMKEKQKTKHESDHNEETDDDGVDEQISSNEGTDKEKSKIKDKLSSKDKSLLSMSSKELKMFKQKLEIQIKEIKSKMEIYKLRMDEIEADKDKEEEMGPRFPIDHIAEIDFHDKIVGRHPICLTVHENGSFDKSDPKIYLNLRSLPSKNIPQTPIEYLLDYLQTSIEMFARQRPKRVFDINGTEIKLIGQLQAKQDIFISYGEDYRPAYEPCLTIQIHNVDIYLKNDSRILLKTFRPDGQIIGEKEKRTASRDYGHDAEFNGL